ncbi:glycosyltransferase family 2 protein [Mesorhizobium sp. LjRoot246]|uniref:glycosyltransferase family 2 protein n=1 Tax=Mesorhizobium sp. LjRoot246 TaxID=3342294 RepID=UPI003ED07F30
MRPGGDGIDTARKQAVCNPLQSKALLSVCIPTFNRRDRISALVQELLQVQYPLQICVHVDGSTDGTGEALAEIASRDARLVVTTGPNGGRGVAMFSAIASATGDYCMIFDDDDDLFTGRLPEVCERLSRQGADGKIAGFVFSMVLGQPEATASPFPSECSNLIKMRADEGVVGDRKEIIRTHLLKQVAVPPAGRFRRVPTSLLWSRLAIEHDVVCVNVDIGRKRYLPEGMTARIRLLQWQNAYPMLLLNLNYIRAFWLGRYRSVRFLGKAVLACMGFGVLSFPFLLKRSFARVTS